jgi:hypothetical protein
MKREEEANCNADGIICLGNNTKATYSKFPVVLNLNNAAYPDSHFDNAKKDFWGNPITNSTAPNIGAYNGIGK